MLFEDDTEENHGFARNGARQIRRVSVHVSDLYRRDGKEQLRAASEVLQTKESQAGRVFRSSEGAETDAIETDALEEEVGRIQEVSETEIIKTEAKPIRECNPRNGW